MTKVYTPSRDSEPGGTIGWFVGERAVARVHISFGDLNAGSRLI